MAYIRKSFQQRNTNNYLLEQDRGISYTSYANPPRPQYNQRGRYGSNQKKYDYHNEINDSREVRARTPSATEYTKYKYESNVMPSTEPEVSGGLSHGKLKKIAKNYAAGIGNTNFSEFNHSQKINSKANYMNIKDFPMEVQKKENVNTRNYDLNMNNTRTYEQPINRSSEQQNRSYERRQRQKQRSYEKKYQEDQYIKDTFERTNEQKIFQKITRINKLNLQINDRLQKILSKVSSD